ncbi:peroxisomal membrane protein pex14 [Vanrija albida]|uniref:Peroxisomal membrane protein PEX14 n=1 Tax=Vanrija albida TaxID=181172 RepID=A0ABR3QH25_9TREE
MAESRAELVRNAVLFLNDPKVQSSSLTQRIEFLQGKGLNESEIQQALHEAANPSSAPAASLSSPVAAPPAYARSAAPGYQTQAQPYVPYGNVYAALPPPEPPKRDWRDVFIMAVVSGGVVYGLAALARKYLTPHLQPPSSTAFQETSQALTEQYDAAAAALADLKAETEALAKSTEAERSRLSAALDEVEEAARAVRDAETRWRDDMREVRGEVESVRELVPRMIEKHSQAQSAALTELQSELRSLKTLLVARQGGAAAPQQPATPATEGGSGAASPTPSATQTAANALLAPRGKASIPAWQLAPSASASNGASASSNASTGTSTTSSPPAGPA